MAKLAYSTDSGSHKKDKPQKSKLSSDGSGPIKVRIEKKGRGGKSVTVIFNLNMEQDDAKDLKKFLSTKLATGATLKNSTIEIRGDHVASAIDLLASKNLKAIKAGG